MILMQMNNPEILLSSLTEYFADVKKPSNLKGKLKSVVYADIFHRRVFGTTFSPTKGSFSDELSTPSSMKDMGFLRTPDSDFLDSTNMQLFRYVWLMFVDMGVSRDFSIKEQTFYTMLYEAQKLYDHRDNPFHNFKHGVSVLHSTYYILRNTKAGDQFDRIGKAAMLFAALMHDVDHTGKTNGYEMNSSSELAIRYNDQSILENHHCATAFHILKEEKFNIFSAFDYVQAFKFRKIAVHGILSTDVKVHFSHLEKFKDKLTQNCFNPDSANNENDFLLLTGQIIHTSDLYVPTKKVEFSKRWSALVNQEFMNQNQAEKDSGLPETPFYKNLDKRDVRSKGEKFFVEKIVMPLWIEMDRYTEGSLETHLQNLKDNLAFWTKEVEEAEAEKEQNS